MSQTSFLDVLSSVEKRNAIPERVEVEKKETKKSVIDFAKKLTGEPITSYFRLTGFAQFEFDLLVRLLSDEVSPHRGKERAVNEFRDQLFLLMNFLHDGSTTLTHILASSYYQTKNSTVKLLHSIVSDIKEPLTHLFLTFRENRLIDMNDVAIVLDCTVLPINRPGGSLMNGKKFYSGKHHIYCVKVEVGVNPAVGTACTISSVHTGSTHDFTVFKEHYPLFKDQLKGSKILADSAYIGAKPELDAIITKPVDALTIEYLKRQKAKNIANEQYRVRMKNRLNPSQVPSPRLTILPIQADNDSDESQDPKDVQIQENITKEMKKKVSLEEKEERDKKIEKESEMTNKERKDTRDQHSWYIPNQWKSTRLFRSTPSSSASSSTILSNALSQQPTQTPLQALLKEKH
ncbi:putative DDE superfamily endonuclease [Monocercomonoides exilis]|uniref:putative DDE superfamily endonuclease n=1 Tax=Monocercomonoides exilis TaxID=2049356 RepID=UPI0035595023|nr:putative DDE superfamily endonuclease [Monocercomonoides exilis]|eukprot:MONOS_5433.1-p1 / transcript=MONOS_5433.1 / gene=MONOS_5433 / organism=Monocercomonoides_exilis_PA203 / gene_product=unspecified product / transcript_product=unspecified product / location=Mono_scaffold00157:104466-106802(-) / protein_length=403 / sequence_SO=supercontig / SO=protein_coding / is_pseudo=false